LTKKLSIVTVTYNQEQLISRTIDAILNQKTDFDIELIIGEDCSTDNTRQIVLGYQNKYPEKIKVITSETNVGIELNYLRCYRVCQGDYVAICDGDDYWVDELKLQKQVDFLENNKEYGLVGTALKYYNTETNEILEEIVLNKNATYSLETVFLKNPFTASTVLFEWRLLDSFLELYEHTPALENFIDYSLWLYFASKKKVAILKDITTAYGVSENAISQNKDTQKAWQYRKRNYNHFKFFDSYIDTIDNTTINAAYYNRAIWYYRLVAVNQDKEVYNEFVKIFEQNDKQRLFLLKILMKYPKTHRVVTLYEKVRNRFFGTGERINKY